MTTYKHKARGVPGGYQLKSGTLVQLTAASAILTTAERGDGTAGTFHAPEDAEVISTASFGVLPHTGTYDVSDVAEGNIIVGASIGGVAGTYPLTATTQAADAATLTAAVLDTDGTDTSVMFGASEGTAGTALVFAAGQADQLADDIAEVETHLADIKNTVVVLTGADPGTYEPDFPQIANVLTIDTVNGSAGTFNAENLSVGNVIQGVTYGVELTGTGENLLATHTTYLSLEAGRNTDPGEGNVKIGVGYEILGEALEGTYEGGGGWTYGANEPQYVLTTSPGTAGTYQPVSTASVQKNVAVGVSPAEGELEGIIDSAGNVTTVGCLVDGTRYEWGTVSGGATPAYHATGVIYGAGSYDTEASRNNTTAAAGDIVSGKNVTIAGVTTSGTLNMASYCLIAGITWPALDEVDGGVPFGPTTGTEYEGTGVNATTAQAACASALTAFVGDTGITLPKALEMLAAFMAGTVTASSADGVTTYSFKKRDGVTVSFTAACSETDGTRASTGALS